MLKLNFEVEHMQISVSDSSLGIVLTDYPTAAIMNWNIEMSHKILFNEQTQ